MGFIFKNFLKLVRFSKTRSISVLFDLVVFFLLAVSLIGGITYHSHLYLKHAADLRRTAFILAFLIFFFDRKASQSSSFFKGLNSIKYQLQASHVRHLLYLVVVLTALLLTLLQTSALQVRLFDVGIFHQILWSLIHGLGFHSTISGAENFLFDHFSPSLALFAPFFWLSRESPYFLSQMHVFLLFGGTAAWLYLSEHLPGVPHRLRSHLSAATLIHILCFDSLWGNFLWGFHENAISFLCISWAITLIWTQPKTKRTLILALLFIAAGSKEIVALDVAGILVIWSISEFYHLNTSKIKFESRFEPTSGTKKSHKNFSFPWIKADMKHSVLKSRASLCSIKNLLFPAFLFLFAIFLFLGFIYFETLPHPLDKNYFIRYYSYLGRSLDSFLIQLVTSPLTFFKVIGIKPIVRYIWDVFAPWLFLPLGFFFYSIWKAFRTRRWPELFPGLWILIILPSFFSALLANFDPLRNPRLHYVLELWPVLALLTIFILGRYGSKKWIYAWALFSIFRMDSDPIGDLRKFWAETNRTSLVRERIAHLPPDAALVATELAGPWVAGRKSVTRWPDTSLLPDQCPNLILVKEGLTELIDSQCTSNFCPPTIMRVMISNCHLAHLKPYFLWKEEEWAAFEFR